MPKHLANKLTSMRSKVVGFVGTIALSLSSITYAATIIPSAPQINAKGFILIDYTTGKVIAEGNADSQLAPASLTKMMTSYIIGKEIEAGNISKDDNVVISETAWAKNFPDSSKMFIEVGTEVSVDLLNQGIITGRDNNTLVKQIY